jgi:hypothetical protein
MKLIKLSFIIAVAVMAIIGISTTSYAFHSGGVASCESCHTMHNSLQGGNMTGTKNTTVGAFGTANPAGSAMFLLRGTDQSSTCLNCHEGPTKSSYHVSTDDATMSAAANHAPVNRGPGGDFGWLKSATTTTTTAAAVLNRRGHNIVAGDFGYNSDTENTVAPGGTFLASNLNCISCHNPHNQLRITTTTGAIVKPAIGSNVNAIAGSISSASTADPTVAAPLGPYRFLRGAGADQAPVSTNYSFNFNPPAVVSPSTYNKSEGGVETHVAYGSGMSDWCGNCHAAMNDSLGAADGGNNHPHPVNKAIGATMAGIYNAYVGSGNLTAAAGTGYSSLVPVEMGTNDTSVLKLAAVDGAASTYNAATATAKVMCLSCHRAHAGAFQSMTRFNVAGNTTDSAGAYALASGMTDTAQALAAYYERPSANFGANTKQLCNKCHNKD